jgi:rhomboid protease GluP
VSGDEPRPTPAEAPPTLLARLRAAPATVILCTASIVVFLLAERAGSTTDVEILVRFGASERSHVWRHEYWRFVTPMFLHIGWIHLLWNVYGIGGWCIPVERALGIPRFLVAYLLSGIFATAASLIGHDAVAAGASGAGFGIVGVTLSILLYRHGSFAKFARDPAVRSILFWIGIWVVLGVTAIRMDNYAHLGGFAFGALLGWIFTQSPKWPVAYRRMAWAMALTVLGFALAAAAKRWPSQVSRYGAHESMVAAEAAFRHGDPKTALVRLDEAKGYGDDAPELFQARAICLELLGRPAEAVADFERALQRAPADWPHRKDVEDQLAGARRASGSSLPPSSSAK